MTVTLSQAVNPSIIESDSDKDRMNDLYVKINVKKKQIIKMKLKRFWY